MSVSDGGAPPSLRELKRHPRPFVSSDQQISQLFTKLRADLIDQSQMGRLNSHLFQKLLDDGRGLDSFSREFLSLLHQYVPVDAVTSIEWNNPCAEYGRWVVPEPMAQVADLSKIFGRIDISHCPALISRATHNLPSDYSVVLLPKLSYLKQFLGLKIGDPYAHRFFPRVTLGALEFFCRQANNSGDRTFTCLATSMGGRSIVGRKVFDPRYWQIDSRVANGYRQLESETSGDVLALPMLTSGWPYNGYSARAGLWEMLHTEHLPLLSAHLVLLLSYPWGVDSATRFDGDAEGSASPYFICAGEQVSPDSIPTENALIRIQDTGRGRHVLDFSDLPFSASGHGGVMGVIKLSPRRTGASCGG